MAAFLDMTSDYLSGGFKRPREKYAFQDDVNTSTSSLSASAPLREENSAPVNLQAVLPSCDDPADDSLEAIAAEITACTRCGLCETRTNAVPGEGVTKPLVMVIGEGPGEDEDRSGRPFVGRAGQLLDRMLDSRGKIGLSRNTNCYIANIVKCRPPENRDPEPEEITACFPYLEGQIQILRPDLILCAGRVAAQKLLKTSKGINSLRGVFSEFYTVGRVVPVLCTFHPSAILRDETLKRPAWEDLKLLRSKLNSLNEE